MLFSCHEQQAYGAVFESPDRSVRVTFSMVGFVDDSTGQVNAFLSNQRPSLDKLVRMMAHDAQLWNDLLYISGGKLEITKCSYHILYFNFRRDGTPYMALGTDSPDLRVQDRQTKQDILVKRLMSFQSHETLGHFKAPSGNQSVHLKHLTKTGVTLARQLYKSSATRAQALIFYWSIYVPSIRYTLPQSFFSPTQLHAAQAKSLPLILAKAGFLRTMPYSVIFGPTRMGGAGFVRWTTLQGEGQILLFLKHWRARDDAGHLLRVALSWAQFQAGTSKPILQDVKSRLPHVEARWIPALRQFLATIDAKLITDTTYIVPLQREGDEHIMDAIITIDEFTDKEIHTLNCCRMYLNVVTISDLTEAAGLSMDAQIAAHQPSSSSTSKLHAPVQERPTTWDLWDVVMKRWFTDGRRLRRPLGRWLQPGSRLRRVWSFYYDPYDNCVYQRVVDGFVRYTRITHGYGMQEVTEWTPTATSVPVTVHVNTAGTITQLDYRHAPTPIVRPQQSSTFDAYVQTLPAWERPLLESISFHTPPFEFLDLWNQHVAKGLSANPRTSSVYLQIVSDGSHINESMTYGWSFALHTGTRIAECSGPGYGLGTSHRAEAYGMLSAVQFVTRLQNFLQIQEPWDVKFVSNNHGLITRITNRHSYSSVYANSTIAPDWDVIEQMYATLRSTRLRPTFVHVKGHQDDCIQYSDLSLDAQMNVDADRLAGTHDVTLSSTGIVPLLPVTGVDLQLPHRTITSHYSQHIRHAAGERAYLDYVCRTNHWNGKTWNKVHHIVLSRVIARHSHRYVTVVKLLHDYLPTSKIRSYSDPTCTTYCEFCHAENSTFAHVMRCPHPAREKWRTEFLQAVRTQCENATTRLGIMQAILAGVSAWFQGTQVDTSHYTSEIKQAVHEQDEIGWHGFLRGFCSGRWASLQHSHFHHNDLVTSTTTGTAWMVSLLTTIWKHVFQVWDDYKLMIHGADRKAQSQQALRRIRTKIRLLHDKATYIRADDRRWLVPNLEVYLQNATLSQLTRWYSTYEPVIVEAIKIARDASTANTRSIRTYFPSTRLPSNAIQQAARLTHRSARGGTARTQAASQQHTPRPRLVPTVRKYFKPVSCMVERRAEALVPTAVHTNNATSNL